MLMPAKLLIINVLIGSDASMCVGEHSGNKPIHCKHHTICVIYKYVIRCQQKTKKMVYKNSFV